MILPNHKTKIVATIGPASKSPEMLESLICAGMNIARLNFSHGSFDQHAEVIDRIRNAAKATGRRLAIMADLPGPKMRLGTSTPIRFTSYLVSLLPFRARTSSATPGGYL